MTTNPPRDDAPERIWVDRNMRACEIKHSFKAIEYRRADTPARAGTWTPTHRHVNRGTEYKEMARGMLQTDVPLSDYAELVAYRGNDGEWWFRPPSEFDDGRFAALLPPEAEPVMTADEWRNSPARLAAKGINAEYANRSDGGFATPPTASTDNTALVKLLKRAQLIIAPNNEHWHNDARAALRALAGEGKA